MKKTLSKLIVIVGPTASGKTELAVKLAKQFNGALVAADSRTIYKGMDIGTGKDKSQPCKLIDVARPDQPFTLSDFKNRAVRAIRAIAKKGKMPILVGGTGLYVWAIVDNLLIPKVPANAVLRREFEKKSDAQLYQLLFAIDPPAAEAIGMNKRRLIRALEVVIASGTAFSKTTKKGAPLFDCLQIGLNVGREELVKRIDRRVDAMMKNGFMQEVMGLRKELYSPGLPAMSGIGYAELNAVIDGKQALPWAVERIKARTRQYARRQMTWFKRDHRINWVSDDKAAFDLVRDFIS